MTITSRQAIHLGTAALTGLLIVTATATPAAATTIRDRQWYLNDLKVAEAQKITRGEGVIVAVVDTEIDAGHPDLEGQILQGAAFGSTTTTNGWANTLRSAHGTHMAGIIVAKGGGANNALGIAPGAKILPVATGDEARRTPTQISQGIRWAADHGARVINLSIAGIGGPASEEVEAVRYALGKDVVVVAAAGNKALGMTDVASPANIPGVVAVSGYTSNSFWSGSVSGPEVAIAAPAVEIINATSRAAVASGYSAGDGSSDAAAIVSGTVALIRAKHPNLNAANVINRLIMTAKDQGPPGRDNQTGYGTVRIVDALTKDVPPVTANPLGTPAASQPTSITPTNQAQRHQPAGSIPTPLLVIGIAIAVVLALGILATIITVIVLTTKRRRPTTP